VSVPSLVDHMILRERCGQASEHQKIGNEQSKEDHLASVVREAKDLLMSVPSEQAGEPDSYRSQLRHRVSCVLGVDLVAAASRRLYGCQFGYRTAGLGLHDASLTATVARGTW
jgi:hypothetical protein